jgi:hypothetical protein
MLLDSIYGMITRRLAHEDEYIIKGVTEIRYGTTLLRTIGSGVE